MKNNNNNKKMNLHKFPIQFSGKQLRRQITLKGFHIVCHHVGQMYPPQRDLVTKSSTMSGQLDIYSQT